MSALEDLRRAQDRDLGTEGIPMYLALVDSTDPAGGPTGTDGAPVAGHLDRLRAELAPTRPDDDLGTVAVLLATAAYVGFGRSS